MAMLGKETDLESKVLLIRLAKLALYCQTPLQLANPTEVQFDRVGVDFVFPYLSQEGRRRNNPHLAFTCGNGPTGL